MQPDTIFNFRQLCEGSNKLCFAKSSYTCKMRILNLPSIYESVLHLSLYFVNSLLALRMNSGMDGSELCHSRCGLLKPEKVIKRGLKPLVEFGKTSSIRTLNRYQKWVTSKCPNLRRFWIRTINLSTLTNNPDKNKNHL